MKRLSHIKKDLRDLNLNISSVEYLLNFALNNKDQLSLIASKDKLTQNMSPFLYKALFKRNHIYKALLKLGIYNLVVTSKDNDKFTVLFKHKDGALISSVVNRNEYNQKPNMAECLALAIIDYAYQASDPNKLESANNAFSDPNLSNQIKTMMENMQKNTSLKDNIDKPGLTLNTCPPDLREAFINQIRAYKLQQELGHEVTVAIPH